MGRPSITQRIASDKRQASKYHKAALTDLRTFISARGYDQKRSSFERLMQSASPRHFHNPAFIAEAHLELATLSSGDEQGFHLSNVVTAIRRAQCAALHPADSVRVATIEANLPFMISAHIEGEHPALAKVRASYQRLASQVASAYHAHKRIPEAAKDPEKTGEFIGNTSEAVALIMLQRFAVEQVGTADYLPLPSLQSQNHTVHKKGYQDTNWDVSVFAEQSIEDPTYKVQVKYGACDDEAYCEDVAVVCMSQLDGPEGYATLGSLVVSLDDAVNSYRPLKNHIALVDRRTETMLDILG